MTKNLGTLYRPRKEVLTKCHKLVRWLSVLAKDSKKNIEPYIRLPSPGIDANREILNDFFGLNTKQDAKADALIKRAEVKLGSIKKDFRILVETSFDEKTCAQVLNGSLGVASSRGTPYTSYKQFQSDLVDLCDRIDSISRRLPYFSESSDGQSNTKSKPSMPALQNSRRIKVVLFAADPDENNRLHIDEEIRSIEKKLKGSSQSVCVQFVNALATRPGDLVQKLSEHNPHIVQFSGHGTGAGEIVMVDDDGNPKIVSKRSLKMLFQKLKDNIRVVFLNVCYSNKLAKEIAQHIDCVIGIPKDIEDNAAAIFASSFYQAIGFGKSVKQAFDEGCLQLKLEGCKVTKPILHKRKGSDPRKIFLVQHSPPDAICND